MANNKIDLFEQFKEEYAASETPDLIQAGPAVYIAVPGQGPHESDLFRDRLGGVFDVAFNLKLLLKKNGLEWRIGKLEGLWQGPDPEIEFVFQHAEEWRWKLLLRVPDVVDEPMVARAVENTILSGSKEKHVKDAALVSLNEGLCLQMLHVGDRESGLSTVQRMVRHMDQNNLAMNGPHHEIYLADARRVQPDRLRTIMRMPVRRTA